MKIVHKLILLLWFLVGCEKDDICTEDTPTTPRLIIEFYDSINTSVKKNVANLKVQGLGAQTELNFNLVDHIEIPLKTTDNSAEFTFIINSTSNSNLTNQDNIRFNYTRNDIYISRACGFKTNFDLNLGNGVEQSNPDGDTEFWIDQIEIVKTKIETENEVHIKMYF
jgi:hypothetical protein